MNKHKSNKIKENSNTVRHLIMGQITTTQSLVAIKEVRHAGQLQDIDTNLYYMDDYAISFSNRLYLSSLHHTILTTRITKYDITNMPKYTGW